MSACIFGSTSTLGYRKYFDKLRDFLYSQPDLANRISIVGKEDRMTTGNFEVTVPSTNQVLHSHKNSGRGKATSDQERVELVEKIQLILCEMMD